MVPAREQKGSEKQAGIEHSRAHRDTLALAMPPSPKVPEPPKTVLLMKWPHMGASHGYFTSKPWQSLSIPLCEK